jgi:hypothetical protein
MNDISTTLSITRQLLNEGVAYAGEIASAASRHGVDPKLLAAVAAQETGGPGTNAGHNIVGDGGHGRGLFQIDDRFHAFARSSAAMDPAQNADYAAAMISGLLQSYGGDVHKALSAYNAGGPNATGTITQWMDGQRLGYADSVLRHCSLLGEPVPPGSSAPASSPSPSDELQQLIGTTLPPALPPSYAQLSGMDANGHSRYDVSYAGLLGDDDSSA